MQITDAIADMLTRIRNAGNAGHQTVEIPASNLKKSIAQILVLSQLLLSMLVRSTPSPESRESVSPVSELMPTRKTFLMY